MSSTLNCDDLQALYSLKARYFRLLDMKDWSAWRELFIDDLIVYADATQGARRDVSFTAADDFVRWVRRFVGDAVTVHHGYMPELRLIDCDSASGVWAMSDFIERREIGETYRGYGHYHETYRRCAGEWQIAEFQLTRIREDTLRTG